MQHGLDGQELARACDVVVEEVGAGRHLTRQDLVARLVARGVASSPAPRTLGMVLLAHVELAGLICSGVRRAGEHTYALMSERVATPRVFDRDEALAELALRYAVSHGPVTERDLSYWATLPLGEVRRGLAVVTREVVDGAPG